MDDDTKNDINIEGNVSAWLANVGGTITVHGNLTLNQWREQQPDERRAQTDAPVFISYARANADFARDLYIKLRALGFRLWRDRSEMAAGENWWGQIQTAISGSQTMVLCMSPEALASPVVADEWRYARRVGTRVIPVVAAEVDFEAVPRWMSKLDWLDFRDGAAEGDIIWEKFITQLNTPPEVRPIPFSVLSLPVHFVARPDVFEPLLAQLLDADRQNPVAMTTALQGGGGFGKTTLAQALCHDIRVRDAFDDGVLWVEFGESPDVLRLLNTQIQTLGGQGLEIDSNTAATRLRDLLEDRDVLLVLDDVWNAAHLRPFLQRTDKTRITVLITTRMADVVNASGAEQPVEVDEMTSQQAVDLLAAGLADAAAEQASLKRLAARLGEWALMLELANGVLRKQAGRYGLAGAIQRINEDLDEEGFVTFDPRSAEARNQSIGKSLNVSLNLLDEVERWRFEAVAIFPEDAEVPVTTLAALWEVGERQALRLCETLADYSLVRFNGQARAIRLHDVVRGILAGGLDDPAALHRRLINNYGDLTTLPDAYAWRNIAYHLVEAEQQNKLQVLLTQSDAWIVKKFNAVGNYESIISDIDLCLDSYTQNTPDEIIATTGLWAVRHIIHEIITSYEAYRLKAMVLIDKHVEMDGKRTQEALEMARLKSNPENRFDCLFVIWEVLGFNSSCYNELESIAREIHDPQIKNKKLSQLLKATKRPLYQSLYKQLDNVNSLDWDDKNFFPNLMTMVVEISDERFDPEIYESEEKYLQEILEDQCFDIIRRLVENHYISEAIYLVENYKDFLAVDEIFEVAGLLAIQRDEESTKIYDIGMKHIQANTNQSKEMPLFEIMILLVDLRMFDQALQCVNSIQQPDLFGNVNRIHDFIQRSRATRKTLIRPDLEAWFEFPQNPQAVASSEKGIFIGSEGAFKNMGLQQNLAVYLSNIALWHKGLETIKNGLSIKVVQEIIRIMAWNDQSWLTIQEILEPKAK